MMKTIMVKSIILFSILFTGITLFSSILNLSLGQTYDTHAHILMRGGFVLIGTSITILFFHYKPRIYPLRYVVPYLLGQTLIFFMVFIIGRLTTLHPDAYRDAFFNFTFVAMIVILVLIGMDVLQSKKRLKNKVEQSG